MSRGKLVRSVVDVCADCGAIEPSWASINKGILICQECCSVHRTLGRHISHVKSLKKGSWVPSQLAMVHALHSNGANSIWEHTLLDPTISKTVRKKPQPKDPLKPIKADFIRTKHQMLGFVFRGNKNDDKDGQINALPEEDVSKQLHSSVRTANLETSLRLLSLGADPNYCHVEKGTYPIHVAAGAGQASQVELLFVYGADPGAMDSQGKLPADHARESGYTDIADRLLECQYELTDRLSIFLCGRKPDHSSGQHFLIPEMSDSIDGNSEASKSAKRKLQTLPNYLFEEIAMDVYDEVDRRETESIWLSLQPPNTPTADRGSVPFLPVNAELSSPRNQARQKLGRLNAREFTTLVIDVLSEAKRRQLGSAVSFPRDSNFPQGSRISRDVREISDDEPVYDSVASEEDYNIAEQQLVLAEQNKSRMIGLIQEPVNTVSVEAYMDIKEQLTLSNRRMHELLKCNNTMQEQISLLQSMVQSLVQENAHLKTETTTTPIVNGPNVTTPISKSPKVIPESGRNVESTKSTAETYVTYRPKSSSTRPFSMYEPREGPRSQRTHTTTSNYNVTDNAYGDVRSTAPLSEEVIKRTNIITKRIQEVFRTVQDGRQDQLGPCAERIMEAVESMALIFNKNTNEIVKSAVQQLTLSASRLRSECNCVYDNTNLDQPVITQRIIQGAYDVAKATKHLVTLFQ